MQQAHAGLMKDLEAKFEKVRSYQIVLTDSMVAKVKLLENEIAVLRRALNNPNTYEEGSMLKIKVPELKQFNGSRNAKELENFLWDMEQYFKATKIPDREHVSITSMYLSGDAKLWWRTRMADDLSAGRPNIVVWESLKKELNDQFLPCNTSWLARENLKKLKQTGPTWAQKELRRQSVKDIPSAMATADGPDTAMLDTGATNNFVAQREANILGLNPLESANRIKAVNSGAMPVHGTAETTLNVGSWQGKCSLMVVPLDDFDLILGVKFFIKAKAMLMPYLRGILIGDEESPCFIQVCGGTQDIKQEKDKGTVNSTKQVDKGLRKGQMTYMAMLVQIKHDVMVDVPNEIEAVLEEFSDVMPAELPRELPLRRTTGHRIDQEAGAKPSTQTPYKMAPYELAELRKQLDGLLEAGLVQPSKAPHGALICFIEGYSKKVSHLTDLLKKDMKWMWSEAYVSDRAFGGVLVQEGYPIAFESRKLKEAEKRYSAHEKEMAAMIHCLDTLRHYLLGTKFTVEYLAEFDFVWVHHPGCQNQVADALSMKEIQGYVYALASLQLNFLDRLKQQDESDSTYTKLRVRSWVCVVLGGDVTEGDWFQKGSVVEPNAGAHRGLDPEGEFSNSLAFRLPLNCFSSGTFIFDIEPSLDVLGLFSALLSTAIPFSNSFTLATMLSVRII
ncbi:hypothetical protein EZV62_024025 [Acer yangbiense]|uniref:Reverse transcriptase/retrotransposon-derived protein RNase H-like domain-containing protein n=1 Tax=Acer yangbiense TaxID=1000413 RepID=A0A5C7H3L1_9ROSI|nr:hypothetical protein EZV62_024025 [Acer yangbiense]